MFCYLDFRCYFEANGQNHIHLEWVEWGFWNVEWVGNLLDPFVLLLAFLDLTVHNVQ